MFNDIQLHGIIGELTFLSVEMKSILFKESPLLQNSFNYVDFANKKCQTCRLVSKAYIKKVILTFCIN